MIRNYYNEQWKEVVFDDKILNENTYKISNYGRIIIRKDSQEKLVRDSYINGYQTLPLKQKKNGKSTSRYVHKLVAEHFLEKKENDKYVIHINYDKLDNKVENLKWATKKEKEEHQFSNPEFKIRRKGMRTYSKLTETKVKLIKRKIHDPNRRTRMKMIAKQFGISEMQLYRIKSGENWGSVTDY